MDRCADVDVWSVSAVLPTADSPRTAGLLARAQKLSLPLQKVFERVLQTGAAHERALRERDAPIRSKWLTESAWCVSTGSEGRWLAYRHMPFCGHALCESFPQIRHRGASMRKKWNARRPAALMLAALVSVVLPLMAAPPASANYVYVDPQSPDWWKQMTYWERLPGAKSSPTRSA